VSLRFPDAPAASNTLEGLSRALRTMQSAKRFTVPDTETLPTTGFPFELLTLNTGGTGALYWWDGAAWQQVAGVATLASGYVPITRTITTTAPLTGGGDLSANRTFSMPAATSGQNGYLSSADWTAFNGKVASGRQINTTAPLTGGGDLSADRTIAMPAASGSTDGYLTSADWTTFNGKAPLISPSFTTPALGTPTSGTLTNCTGLPQSGVVGVGTNTIVTQPPAGLETNLVAAWNLEGNSIDSIGSNTGSDTSITYNGANGRYGIGAGLNGTTSKIDLANIVTGTTDITIAMWIKTSAANGYLISQRDGSGSGFINQWSFRIASNKLMFWDHTGGAYGFDETVASTTSVNDGTWRLVAFTRSGTAGTYYVNGVADGTKTAASLVSYGSLLGAIGYNRRDSATFFAGSISKVQVWTRALSAAEMLSLYNGGRGLRYPFYVV
jgi:hypothetical protein